jgi:RNA polymerase sigma factor (sigma-70 family)
VVKIAKEFMGRGLPLEDLIAEGNEGLLHAIDRFDPSRGFRITTYSAAWIRQRIGRAIASKSKMVRIPQYIWEVVGKTHKLWADLGRMPTVGEVKEKHDKYDETTIKRAIDYMGASITSLDTMTPSGLPLRELVGDDHAENPVESAEQTERHTILRQAISELPDPLRETLRMRYGFSDLGPVEPMTLQEIAVIEGVTREAVRQRVTRAENILRNTIIKRA